MENMEKFFAKHGKPEYAFKMVKDELRNAKKALEEDALPNGNHKEIFSPNTPDKEFMDLYESNIKGSFPNELGEAVIKIMDMAEEHGYDLKDYLPLIERYCELKTPQKTSKKMLYRYL